MVKPEVVEDHKPPVIVLQFPSNVPSDIVVDFREILRGVSNQRQRRIQCSEYADQGGFPKPRATYGNEETRCPVLPVESVRE